METRADIFVAAAKPPQKQYFFSLAGVQPQ